MQKCHRVHRLVAEVFLTNSNNLPEINHKDCIKTNNVYTNLEYCNRIYNINYADRTEKVAQKKRKPVKQLNIDGTLIKIWPSASEAGKNGYSRLQILYCCNGRQKTHLGYRWVYLN